MSSPTLAFVFQDNDDDFVNNTQAMPNGQPLLTGACSADAIESGALFKNNVVPFQPAIDIDDQSDFIFEDDDEAESQDEIMLTSSGCSLKPRHRSASRSSEEAAGPLEIVLTDTASKLKAPNSDVAAVATAKVLQADMVVSTETPGCDLEESLYFTIGGMIIPSFFAEAAGHAVKTRSVSYDTLPSGWDASIDDIGAAFEKSSALLAYLAGQSNETAMTEAFKGMSEEENASFGQAFETARAEGYCLFAHSGSLDGLFSVALPVYANDEVIGAVGIFVPRALTCSDNLEKHLLPQLRQMADAVAQSSNMAMAATETTEVETAMAMAA